MKKILSILWMLVGLAFASQNRGGTNEFYWETSKEYVYEYSGRLLNGIPELSDVYSGIGINCTVHIQRTDADGKFYLSVRNLKYVRVNEKLENVLPMGPFNWRTARLPELSEVSGEFANILSRPIKFSLSNGVINSAEVSKDEPIWSINFKKALALLFQTKFDVSTNGWEQRNNKLQSDESDEQLSSWRVKEETIDGICENLYEIQELDKRTVQERPDLVPFPEACTEERYYVLTKTRDIAQCEKRSAFNFFAPGHFGQELYDNNVGMWARSSNTRYVACGTRGLLTIQFIVNDGELNTNLLGYNTELFTTGTLQKLSLIKILPARTVDSSGETVPLKSLMFEYSRESLFQKSNNKKENLRGLIPNNLLSNPEVIRQSLPRNFLYGVKSSDVTSDEIKTQIIKFIPEIVIALTTTVDTKDKNIISKALAVSRGFQLFRSKSEIRSVYEELKRQYTSNEQDLASFKNTFFDTLLMSGSPLSILFIKDSILSGEMAPVQITTFFLWLPSLVKVPTDEVLQSIFDLISNDKVRSRGAVHSKAIMGLSSLLNRACISKFRNTTHPVHVFGELCRPESAFITKTWIPYLAHDLKYSTCPSRRNDIIVALGLMQQKSIVGELIPIVEGSDEYQFEVTKLNRYLAIHSLANAASNDPGLVIPIFVSILSNPSESTSVRIAAFNALLRLNPSMAVLQKIASLTWAIKDEELLKVINSAFLTLKLQKEKLELIHTTLTLHKKASLLYPMIKKVPGPFPTSGTRFSGEYLKNLGVGFKTRTSWIGSKTGAIPNDVYTEVLYYLDEYKFSPISIGLRLSGIENLYHDIEQLLKPITSESEGDEDDESNQNINGEWEKIIQELKVKSRKNTPLDGAFFLRWFESSPIFYNFDKLSVQEFRKRLGPFLTNPESLKEKVCGTFPINFQQTLDRAPNVFMVASDMGFPIILEFHMPMALSIRGDLNVKCDTLAPSISIKTSVVANSQYSGWLGTTIPFTKEYSVTGVEEDWIMNFPVNIALTIEPESGKLSFNVKPETEPISKAYDLAHYHVLPYVTYKKVADLTPLTSTPNLVTLNSSQKSKLREKEFGELLGLKMKFVVHTQSPFADLRGGLDIFKLYNSNPANLLRFMWTSPSLSESGKASLRPHDFSLVFDPTSSSTKEVQFDFEIGYGERSTNQQNIQYALIKQHGPGEHYICPFKFDLVDIDSQSLQPLLQEKIKQALQKLDCKSAHAVSIVFTTTLKAGRPLAMSYVLTYAAGNEVNPNSEGQFKRKWAIKLESQIPFLPVKEICFNGEVAGPRLPIWNVEELQQSLINFKFNSDLGFGKSSCSESSVKVSGTAKVSEEQKEISRTSVDSQKCSKFLSEKGSRARLYQDCENTRLQASTIDDVEFKVEFENAPPLVHYLEARASSYIKAFFWQYHKSSSKNQGQQSAPGSPIDVQLRLYSQNPSFDLIINKTDESTAFSRVRIPSYIRPIFPLKAGRNYVYSALKSVSGSSFNPMCKVSTQSLVTFDRKYMPLEIDDCFHLLSGDCSRKHSFGILARRVGSNPESPKYEVKVFLGESVLLFTPSEDQNTPIRATFDNEEVALVTNVWKSISNQNGRDIVSIYRSSDNVFKIKSESIYKANFLFDGSNLVIFGSRLLKSKLCGICGNYNLQSRDDMTGPSQCQHSKPETLIASYRVQSSQCKQLPSNIERELEQDQQSCNLYEDTPTKISQSLKAQSAKCTSYKHIVVERPQEICISKDVVSSCKTECKAAEGAVVNKMTEFVCLPRGRLADLYVQKAANGQQLPELQNMETNFITNVQQPKRCISGILKA